MARLEVDVIVIGGGHAGCEAAHAAARMGCRTVLLTMNASRIGFMSCNPAIGGLAKGQLVKEVDALGGLMARITDQSAIQYRILNASKGPAVRSSRAQCDKAIYAERMQQWIEKVPNLRVVEAEASEIIVEGAEVRGIKINKEEIINARSLVITSGTFLKALMYTGFDSTEGGRMGDASAYRLSDSIRSLGLRLIRLKTGTPPRLHQRSVNFARLEPQPGDERPEPFSFYYRGTQFPELPQVNCYITYTNERTHEIIEKNFDRSPMFTGLIQGVGPRYCPSIEDKVKRFRERDRHQIFLEPEGLSTDEVYVNGMSTSLPAEVQEDFIRSIEGLENAEFIRYGYAVEYDAVDATQLKNTFECKDVAGLFFAGQVNGTSGYEEAAGQGLLAGINAAQRCLGRGPFVLKRDEAYIGVMADDLVLKGVDEPYRMFTSRAEFRLLLREDNADFRLSPKGRELGLLSDHDCQIFDKKLRAIAEVRMWNKVNYLMPTESINLQLKAEGVAPLKDRSSFEQMLKRPEFGWEKLKEWMVRQEQPIPIVDDKILELVEIDTKYEGYIARDRELIEGVGKNEELRIPLDFDYEIVGGLSSEVRIRLSKIRPETLGQATRIQGVTPAAAAALMIHLKFARERPNRRLQ